MFKQYGYPQITPLLVLMEKFENWMMTAVALLDYHFHAWSAAYVLAVQEFAVAFSDTWFAAYALAVQDSAVQLLHYPLLAWLAVYAVAGRGGVPAVFLRVLFVAFFAV